MTKAAALFLDDLGALVGDLDTFGVQMAGETGITIYSPEGREVVPPWQPQILQTVKIIYIYKLGDRKTLMAELEDV